MSRVLEFIRRYPAVALTVTVGLLALAAFFVLDDGPAVARVLVTAFALVVAVQQGWGMVQDALRGRWGLDVLAITAILSTLAVGEYWASIVIVLMLTGGEALEDYAETRARRELTGLLSRAPRSAHLVLGEGSVLDVGLEKSIIQKSGSYFSFGDERLGQGRQNATAFLREHPDIVQSILQGIQAQAADGQVISARLLPTSGEPTEVTPVSDEADVEAETSLVPVPVLELELELELAAARGW